MLSNLSYHKHYAVENEILDRFNNERPNNIFCPTQKENILYFIIEETLSVRKENGLDEQNKQLYLLETEELNFKLVLLKTT